MSTTFADTTASVNSGGFSVIDLCANKRVGSTFQVPSGSWSVDSVKVNLAAGGAGGHTWSINLDVYTVSSGTIGTLVGNLVTGFSYVVPGDNGNHLVDFTSSITPVTVTGGTDYWLLISDPTSTGVQVNFTDAPPVLLAGEFTANCNPAVNALNNTPVTMFVAGDPAASAPSPGGAIPLIGNYAQSKAGFGINQKIIAIPEMSSFEEVRQVIARAVGELQNHIATQLPIIDYKQRKITNVAPPTEADDVVTLKYLQSVQLPAQPKSN